MFTGVYFVKASVKIHYKQIKWNFYEDSDIPYGGEKKGILGTPTEGVENVGKLVAV